MRLHMRCLELSNVCALSVWLLVRLWCERWGAVGSDGVAALTLGLGRCACPLLQCQGRRVSLVVGSSLATLVCEQHSVFYVCPCRNTRSVQSCVHVSYKDTWEAQVLASVSTPL